LIVANKKKEEQILEEGRQEAIVIFDLI